MPCQVNNNSNYDTTEIDSLIQDLFSFAQNRFGFRESPVLNLESDPANTSPLGKTAYYDPSSMEIVIYVDNRHPKDIMRSFAHELVHHNQNENGMFDNITGEQGQGYAQKNKHLRKMEKQAYLEGNLCLRDFEDGLKKSGQENVNERRIHKMSIKKWKEKELNGLLNERWGFSMNLDKLNEGCGEESYSEEPCAACNEDPCSCSVIEEMEMDNQEYPVEVVDEPSVMTSPTEPVQETGISTLEDMISELTVDQLKAALAAKQGH